MKEWNEIARPVVLEDVKKKLAGITEATEILDKAIAHYDEVLKAFDKNLLEKIGGEGLLSRSTTHVARYSSRFNV